MNQNIESIVEEIAFNSIKENNPGLLKIVQTFVARGFTSEQIIDICVEKSGQPRHKLAFIGCAADYLRNQKSMQMIFN